MNYGNENITFEIVTKNNKPFVRMTSYGTVTDMKVWKANTDAPYIKHLGMVFFLNDYLKKQLA